MRRIVFWVAVASPLLVIGVALLIAGVLDLFGAECVTDANNPLVNDVCNPLGAIQSEIGWIASGLVVVLVPVALITGAVGALGTMTRQ